MSRAKPRRAVGPWESPPIPIASPWGKQRSCAFSPVPTLRGRQELRLHFNLERGAGLWVSPMNLLHYPFN